MGKKDRNEYLKANTINDIPKINEETLKIISDSSVTIMLSTYLENEMTYFGKIPGTITYNLKEATSWSFGQFPGTTAKNVSSKSLRFSLFDDLVENISKSDVIQSPLFGPILGATIGTAYDTIVNGEDLDNAIAGNILKTVTSIGVANLVSIGLSTASITFAAGSMLPFLGMLALGYGIDFLYESNAFGVKNATKNVVDSIGKYFNDRSNFEVNFLNSKEQMNLDYYSKGNY